MYHLPRVCRTLVPEIRVHPEILCVFHMPTCVIYNCTRLNSQERHERLELLVSALNNIDEDR